MCRFYHSIAIKNKSYRELNVLPVKQIYLKVTAMYLKNHNILHKISTRYANNNFIIKPSKNPLYCNK